MTRLIFIRSFVNQCYQFFTSYICNLLILVFQHYFNNIFGNVNECNKSKADPRLLKQQSMDLIRRTVEASVLYKLTGIEEMSTSSGFLSLAAPLQCESSHATCICAVSCFAYLSVAYILTILTCPICLISSSLPASKYALLRCHQTKF